MSSCFFSGSELVVVLAGYLAQQSRVKTLVFVRQKRKEKTVPLVKLVQGQAFTRDDVSTID